MASWEEESDEEVAVKPIIAPPAAPNRRFQGEDEDEDVVDDWDASSDDEKAPAPTPVAPPKKKGTLKAAIAAKEAERARLAEEEQSEDEVIDEVERKRRDKAEEVQTDLLNATSLLSGTSISGNGSASLSGITDFDPKTKEDFIELSNRLIELTSRLEDKPLYATFVEHHVRALAAPLRDVDVRKAASGLTTLANEKQKEQRDKASGKKKTVKPAKPALGGAKQAAKLDTTAYQESLDDFADDDFM